MDPPRANEREQAEECVGITSTIDVPFLEKHLTGDVLATYSVLSKLHCEDLCLRNLHCKGFNYKEQKCEILSDIYNANDKGISQGTRAFMKTVTQKSYSLVEFVTQGTSECVTCPKRVCACAISFNAFLAPSATRLKGGSGDENKLTSVRRLTSRYAKPNSYKGQFEYKSNSFSSDGGQESFLQKRNRL